MKPLFRRHWYGPHDSNKLVVVFCPYGIGAWQFALPGLPIWRMRRAGWRVLAYDYPLSIANRNAQHSVKSVEALVADAVQAMGGSGATTVGTYGTSFGGLPALLLAVRSDQVSRAVLNVPWTDLPVNIDHLPPMILIPGWLRRRFVEQSGGREELAKTFAAFQPAGLAARLRPEVRVLLWVSRSDRILQYEDGHNLRRALAERLGKNLDMRVNEGTGHYLSALRNNLDFRSYMAVLDSAEQTPTNGN